MTEPRKQTLQKEVLFTKHPFTPNNDDFICQLLSETPDRDPYMGIDTPSDEFYNINTNQSGLPISARHKLQPRLLRSNPNTNHIHSQRNQSDNIGLVLYQFARTYIQMF